MTNVDDRAPAPRPGPLRDTLPAIGAAVSSVVIFVSVLSIPLAAAAELELSAAETTGWILGLYGVSGALSLVLVLRYRQPLLLTGNIFVLIFISQLGGEVSWPELVGASMVAGGIVLVLGPLGLIDRLAAWLPAPIVFGLLAGAVLPFFVDLFTELERARLVVGGTLAAYVLGRRFLEPRLPAILPALVVGVVLAGVDPGFNAPATVSWPVPSVTAPVFSVSAIVTATPVMVVLITLQANVPAAVFLRSQHYQPPERTLTLVSGAGTLLGSLLGPMGVSLSLPATALCASEGAGEHRLRHRSVYFAAGGAVVIALLAGLAADLAGIVPSALLTTLVGLAVFGVLAGSIQQVAQGPLLVGPLFAFAIALTDLSMLGLGPFFWALVLGLGVSLLVERDGWQAPREADRAAG